jgi:hypothetical protein
MSHYYCKGCGGEMVSCECPDIIHDDYDGPDGYLPEDIDDRYVVATMNDAGAWRIEVTR